MFMVSIGHILSTCSHAIFDSKASTVPSIWSVGARTCTCMDRTYIGGQ